MPLRNNFGSLLTAMITPFDRQQKVDYEQVAKLAKYLQTEVRWSGYYRNYRESPALSEEENFVFMKQ